MREWGAGYAEESAPATPGRRRGPEPISVLTVLGLLAPVLGVSAWPLTGYWQAPLIGLTLCVCLLVIEAARMQRRRVRARHDQLDR